MAVLTDKHINSEFINASKVIKSLIDDGQMDILFDEVEKTYHSLNKYYLDMPPHNLPLLNTWYEETYLRILDNRYFEKPKFNGSNIPAELHESIPKILAQVYNYDGRPLLSVSNLVFEDIAVKIFDKKNQSSPLFSYSRANKRYRI